MAIHIGCPVPEDLRRYQQQKLAGANALRVKEHLESCLACAQTLAEMSRTTHGQRRDGPHPDPGEPHWGAETLAADQAGSSDGGAPEGESRISLSTELDSESIPLSPAQDADELGRLGGYRILKVLGRGGMGLVYLAEDVQLHRNVALKVMLPAIARREESRRRFLREARAAAAIDHDNLVTIYQVGEENGVPFLAMPLLEGVTLEERLRQGGVTLSEAVRIGREIASGLAAAQQRGLVHRDIKPANIWLDARANNRVKILDFGLARGKEDVHVTQSGMIVGTPAYMAPEQARGEVVDGRADLFSLGCVLYQLCTGQLPFRGNDVYSVIMALATHEPVPPRQLNPKIPQALSALIMQLLAKNADDRPSSAAQVARVLEGMQRGRVHTGKQTQQRVQPAAKQTETGRRAADPKPPAGKILPPGADLPTAMDVIAEDASPPPLKVPPRHERTRQRILREDRRRPRSRRGRYVILGAGLAVAILCVTLAVASFGGMGGDGEANNVNEAKPGPPGSALYPKESPPYHEDGPYGPKGKYPPPHKKKGHRPPEPPPGEDF